MPFEEGVRKPQRSLKEAWANASSIKPSSVLGQLDLSSSFKQLLSLLLRRLSSPMTPIAAADGLDYFVIMLCFLLMDESPQSTFGE